MPNLTRHIKTKLGDYKTLYFACLLLALSFGGWVASKSDLVWFETEETPIIQVEEIQEEPLKDLESEESQKLVDAVDPQKTDNTRIVRRLNALI